MEERLKTSKTDQTLGRWLDQFNPCHRAAPVFVLPEMKTCKFSIGLFPSDFNVLVLQYSRSNSFHANNTCATVNCH